MRLDAVLLATALALPSAGAAAGPATPETTLAIVYDVSVLGLSIGEMKMEASFTESAYSVRAWVSPKGIASAITSNAITAAAQGAGGPGVLAPSYSQVIQTNSKKTQTVTMTYRDGLPAEVVAEPSYGEQPHAPTEEQMQGSIDPLSGVIALMLMPSATAEAPCGTEVPVYDGRRRYSFDMSSAGWVTVEGSGVGGYTGVALHCMAKYRRIAGWDAERLARKTETVVDGYYAPIGQRADGLPLFYLPVRLWGDAEVGDVVARPKSVTINGMPWEQYFAQGTAGQGG
jgi:hypothetical protein